MWNRRGVILGAMGAAAAPCFGEPNPEGKPRVMLGPMIGPPGTSRVPVWLRMSGDYFDAVIEYTDDLLSPDWHKTAPFRASAADGFTVRTALEGLSAGTQYSYRLRVDGGADRYLRRFPPFTVTTAPRGPARFSVGFGSCARVQDDPYQPVWDAVGLWDPDLFLWLGDNIYGDSLNPEIIASEYERQRFVPAFQKVGRSIPQMAIWDDHDFGLDNFDRTNPIKRETLELFHRYWINPKAGTAQTAGVFFDYSYGGVDFFCLDGRYHRDPNAHADTEDKTLLGRGQFDWLKDKLAASRAPFKVLACGSGWSKLKGPGGDSWASFLNERQRLIDFIREQNITGVILLSGDTHFPQVNCIPASQQGGYDLYDCVSSALAQVNPRPLEATMDPVAMLRGDRPIRPAIFGINNFGLLAFDMTRSDPSVTVNVIDSRGQTLWSPLTLLASELRNGVESWPRKTSL